MIQIWISQIYRVYYISPCMMDSCKGGKQTKNKSGTLRDYHISRWRGVGGFITFWTTTFLYSEFHIRIKWGIGITLSFELNFMKPKWVRILLPISISGGGSWHDIRYSLDWSSFWFCFYWQPEFQLKVEILRASYQPKVSPEHSLHLRRLPGKQ